MLAKTGVAGKQTQAAGPPLVIVLARRGTRKECEDVLMVGPIGGEHLPARNRVRALQATLGPPQDVVLAWTTAVVQALARVRLA